MVVDASIVEQGFKTLYLDYTDSTHAFYTSMSC